jgi:2-methylaconitate cis-trans-isomerase PrpF
MAAIGGPDPRQVDGLGGADLLLSKVAIVEPGRGGDADVECRFGSIPPGSESVKYGANCGNLSSAVALFSTDEGLADGAAERIGIRNTDSGTFMEARFLDLPRERIERLARFGGMPATGRAVELTFLDPVGTATAGLLPTGRTVDVLELPGGRRIEASIIDAGALYVFIRGSDLELPSAPSGDHGNLGPEAMDAFERLRGQAAVMAGLVRDVEEARRVSPAVPKLAFVGPPVDYRTAGSGLPVAAGDVDLVGRIISSQSVHKAYAVTGAIATAAAAVVPGSVANRVLGEGWEPAERPLRIGHPSGVIECRIEPEGTGSSLTIRRAGVFRTARRILDGRCYP